MCLILIFCFVFITADVCRKALRPVPRTEHLAWVHSHLPWRRLNDYAALAAVDCISMTTTKTTLAQDAIKSNNWCAKKHSSRMWSLLHSIIILLMCVCVRELCIYCVSRKNLEVYVVIKALKHWKQLYRLNLSGIWSAIHI